MHIEHFRSSSNAFELGGAADKAISVYLKLQHGAAVGDRDKKYIDLSVNFLEAAKADYDWLHTSNLNRTSGTSGMGAANTKPLPRFRFPDAILCDLDAALSAARRVKDSKHERTDLETLIHFFERVLNYSLIVIDNEIHSSTKTLEWV
jgi:hypothetical protein